MEIIDGKKLADEILCMLKEANDAEGLKPCLAILDVGENQDNKRYIGLKVKAAATVGGSTTVAEFGHTVGRDEVLAQIQALNLDESIDGILLQLPLPDSLAVFQEELLAAIVPAKDVDGFSPHNLGLLMNGDPLFISCAAEACLEVCRRYAGPLKSKKVMLVGDSFDVIRSLAVAFIREGSLLTVLPEYDSASLNDCDIAIIEKGIPNMVGAQGLKDDVLLIDAGFYWESGRTCGNIDPARMADVDGHLLPVPGGMGPLLVAHLMMNLSRAARRAQKGI